MPIRPDLSEPLSAEEHAALERYATRLDCQPTP